jgi:hypothetical protein
MVQKDHPSYLSKRQISELDDYSSSLSEVLARVQLIKDLPTHSMMYYIGLDKELHGFSCKKISNDDQSVLVKIKGQHRRLGLGHMMTVDIFNAIKSQALLLGEPWPPKPF